MVDENNLWDDYIFPAIVENMTLKYKLDYFHYITAKGPLNLVHSPGWVGYGQIGIWVQWHYTDTRSKHENGQMCQTRKMYANSTHCHLRPIFNIVVWIGSNKRSTNAVL